jgi:hypothetical protein
MLFLKENIKVSNEIGKFGNQLKSIVRKVIVLLFLLMLSSMIFAQVPVSGTWPRGSVHFFDYDIIVRDGDYLRIEDDVVVYFDNAKFIIEGILEAGTLGQRQTIFKARNEEGWYGMHFKGIYRGYMHNVSVSGVRDNIAILFTKRCDNFEIRQCEIYDNITRREVYAVGRVKGAPGITIYNSSRIVITESKFYQNISTAINHGTAVNIKNSYEIFVDYSGFDRQEGYYGVIYVQPSGSQVPSGNIYIKENDINNNRTFETGMVTVFNAAQSRNAS